MMQNTALAEHTQTLIRSLDMGCERMRVQPEQRGSYPTVGIVSAEYEDLAKRLGQRLAGNPCTLRRRLGTLKSTLARRLRVELTLRNMEELSERARNDAVVRYAVLYDLIGKLEVTIRPGLARR